MASNRSKPGRVRDAGDPNRPAYDNPVGNKGGLAAGSNAAREDRGDPKAEPPQGHDSDKKLGQKPPKR